MCTEEFITSLYSGHIMKCLNMINKGELTDINSLYEHKDRQKSLLYMSIETDSIEVFYHLINMEPDVKRDINIIAANKKYLKILLEKGHIYADSFFENFFFMYKLVNPINYAHIKDLLLSYNFTNGASQPLSTIIEYDNIYGLQKHITEDNYDDLLEKCKKYNARKCVKYLLSIK